MITENLSTLKIHKLTQAQYDRELEAGRIDQNAIYLTPDEDIDLSEYATKEDIAQKANMSDVEEIKGKVGDKSVSEQITEAIKNKADSGHIHEDINVSIDNLNTLVGDKTVSEQISSVTDGLQAQIDEKAPVEHTHDFPVDSVNGQTGDVMLTTDDVGAAQSLSFKDCGAIYGTGNHARWQLAFGKGIFVAIEAVPNSSWYEVYRAAYSYNGINWENTVLPSAKWTSVTYGNDKFVAVGLDGATAYSEDGITWISGTSSIRAKSVTYGYGKFVSVGFSGSCAYSTDGINWTVGSFPTQTYTYYSVCYGNNMYIATGIGCTSYSHNGIIWVESTTSIYGQNVTYGCGKFILNCSNDCVYSTDGVNWNYCKTEVYGGSVVCSSDEYGRSLFIYYSYFGDIASSTDGINWIRVLNKPSCKWTSAVCGYDKFIIAGYQDNLNSFNYDVAYSIDTTIDGTASISYVDNCVEQHLNNKNNPHGVTAAQVGALSTAGGTMAGNIDMGGQKITGLAEPTGYDQPLTRPFLSTYVGHLAFGTNTTFDIPTYTKGNVLLSITLNGAYNENGFGLIWLVYYQTRILSTVQLAGKYMPSFEIIEGSNNNNTLRVGCNTNWSGGFYVCTPPTRTWD